MSTPIESQEPLRAERGNVTDGELYIIDKVRENKAEKNRKIRKEWNWGRLQIDFVWNSRHSRNGRFGGGYNWKLGIEAGSWRSPEFLLFICRLGFYFKPKEVKRVQPTRQT